MFIKVRPSKKAKKLLEDCDINKPPIDLDVIASHLGLRIFKDEFPSGMKVSAVLLKEADEQIIVVNKKDPEVRRRFSIAHEIGHVSLHADDAYLTFEKNIEDQKKLFFRSEGQSTTSEDDELEMEANQFAAELLMKEKWVIEDFKKLFKRINKEDIIELLANKYEVSKTAMMFRIMNLKLV